MRASAVQDQSAMAERAAGKGAMNERGPIRPALQAAVRIRSVQVPQPCPAS